MAIKKSIKTVDGGASQKKPRTKKTVSDKVKKKAVKSSTKYGMSPEECALRLSISDLKTQLEMYQNKYGELLASTANMKMKLDVLLGQLLKGLYVMGITPEDILKKCSQMFEKAES